MVIACRHRQVAVGTVVTAVVQRGNCCRDGKLNVWSLPLVTTCRHRQVAVGTVVTAVVQRGNCRRNRKLNVCSWPLVTTCRYRQVAVDIVVTAVVQGGNCRRDGKLNVCSLPLKSSQNLSYLMINQHMSRQLLCGLPFQIQCIHQGLPLLCNVNSISCIQCVMKSRLTKTSI